MLCGMKRPDKNNKNVLGMFSMDTREFRDRVNHLTNGAGIAAPEVHRFCLNQKAALDTQGKTTVLIGCVVLVIVWALWVWLSGDTPSLWGLPASFVILGFIGYGLSKVYTSRRIRFAALEDIIKLEGDDGFLWRFEQFLTDWDESLPEPVRQSLPVTCRASKDKSIQTRLDQPALRAYWFWVSQLKGRMEVALETLDE